MAITINGSSGISGVDGSAGTPALRGSDSNSGIIFTTDQVSTVTGGVTRATVDSSGYLRLASNGIQFNGDTAAANALDDYEEGTWTPSFVQAGTTNNMYVNNGLTVKHADYRKIGNLVYVSCYIQNDASFSYDTGRAGTNALGIGGLPFTVSNTPTDSGYHPIYVGGFGNWTSWSAGYTPMGYCFGGLNSISLVYATANGITSVTANFVYSANSSILLSGWYETN